MLTSPETNRLSFIGHLTQLDPRSLLLMRIGLGLTLLVDLVERRELAPYFFTEQGILPEQLWQTLFGHKSYYWSLHFFESATAVHITLTIQMLLAIGLLLGHWPRLMALLSWFLLLSLNLRNPMLTYGGDKLAPTLLLIASLLPLPSASKKRKAFISSKIGAPVLVVQMAILYIAAGFSKAFESNWLAGSALRNALNFDLLVKPFGVWLSQFESLLAAASWSTPVCEIAFGTLLLLPIGRNHTRTIGVLGLLGLNLGIWLTMDVGYFMLWSSAALLGLLPSSFWSALEPVFPKLTLTETSIRPPGPVTIPAKAFLGLQRTAGVWLILVFSVTFTEGLKVHDRLPWPSWLWTAIRAPNHYQNWDLFKNPGSTAEWYVSKAKLNDNTIVDILRDGAAVDYRRKRSRNDLFAGSFRWRLCFAKANKYWKHTEARDSIARNVARHWNDHQSSNRQATSISIYKMSKKLFKETPTTRHYKPFSEIDAL